MKIFLKNFYNKYLTSEESAYLILAVLLFFLITLTNIITVMAPFLGAVVLAYILQGVIKSLRHLTGLSQYTVSLFVFITFILIFFGALMYITPILYGQVIGLDKNITNTLANINPSNYAEMFPILNKYVDLETIIGKITVFIDSIIQFLLSNSLNNISSMLTILVYSFVIPTVLFFMLSDKNNIVSWVKNIVGPSNNQKQIHNIIININNQLSSYIRGKLIESAIVGMATYVVFLFFGMPYAELLSIATGISVVIPYVGIAIVAVPTILVAIAHFGMGTELYSMFAIYTLIQILDGNILVPILFSSAVKIHPIFIIMVIIVCGNIWGVWGVFFAIPIAILVKNVVFNWPKNKTPIKTS